MTIYLSENIKRLRREKDLTQETLAEFLGVTFQSVSYSVIWHEQCFYVVKTVFSFSENIQSEVDFDVRMRNHIGVCLNFIKKSLLHLREKVGKSPQK